MRRDADGTRGKPIIVLIPGIDAVKAKNIHQYSGLARFGYKFIVMTTDGTGFSQQIAARVNNVTLWISSRCWVRSWFVISLLRIFVTHDVHIAEIYPGSLLTLILTFMCWCRRIPIVIVARGEELPYVRGTMAWRQRPWFRLTYALARHVIYKELYMLPMLKAMGKERITLIGNAVCVPELRAVPHRDGCRFLFMNAIKSFRNPELALGAFLKLCDRLSLRSDSNVRFDIVGLTDERAKSPWIDAERERRLARLIAGKDVPVGLHPWTNEPEQAEQWLNQADVFLLPADIVYLNYALLEAMARGVPVIIQEVEGASLIVSHGVEGYVVSVDEEKWCEHMQRLVLDPGMRKKMGVAARRKVETSFSYDEYLRKYDRVYRGMLKR